MLRRIYFIGLMGIITLNVQAQGDFPGIYYSEPHRPQYHFTPPAKWMNDPNGMVYYEGEYHLFYQYFPDSTVWGPMHWAHAVSKDLLHWKHLPIALYPDTLGYIFSGSAVVDWNNSSGFGKNGKPPLVAIFTYHDMEKERSKLPNTQSQAIAYSNDRGRTWTKFAGNPVIPNPGTIRDFRDPKVFWHSSSNQWVMALAVGDHIELWGAPDLKKWTYLSTFGKAYGSHGGVWECPDLFPLKVEETGEEKWVLIVNINPGHPNGGSGTQYFVGHFDGKIFILEPSFIPDVANTHAVWMDWGRDHYAAVSWSDIPQKDGRRLMIAWMSNWDYATRVPTRTWRSGATLPREITLHKTGNTYRLKSMPVKELGKLRTKKKRLPQGPMSPGTLLAEVPSGEPFCYELSVEIDLVKTTAIGFSIYLSNELHQRYEIGYDINFKEFYSDRKHAGDLSFADNFATKVHKAPRTSSSIILPIRLYIDAASVELFADQGETCLTELFFPTGGFTKMHLHAIGGEVWIKSGMISQVKSTVKKHD